MNTIEYLAADENGALFFNTSNNMFFVEYHNEDGYITRTKEITREKAKIFVLESFENCEHTENIEKYLNINTPNYYPDGLLN